MIHDTKYHTNSIKRVVFPHKNVHTPKTKCHNEKLRHKNVGFIINIWTCRTRAVARKNTLHRLEINVNSGVVFSAPFPKICNTEWMCVK